LPPGPWTFGLLRADQPAAQADGVVLGAPELFDGSFRYLR